jgi:sporulation protein YlmC with PRC-barrel domain
VKKPAIAVTACLLALGLATGASAQTRPSGGATPPPSRVDDAQRPAWAPESGAVESSKLVGTKVQTADGKDIGSIDQLIVSHKDGKITHAVLGKGGVLGMGATKLVLKWTDLKLQRDPDHEDRWLAVVDQAKLDAAPRFEARKDRDSVPAASPATPPAPGKPAPPAKRY